EPLELHENYNSFTVRVKEANTIDIKIKDRVSIIFPIMPINKKKRRDHIAGKLKLTGVDVLLH
ncbi:MAG: hypothetical protein AAFU03_08395, partial [Bacteroidota bacterium]